MNRPRVLPRALAGTAFALLLLALAEGLLQLILGPPPAPPLFRATWRHERAPFEESGGQVRPLFQGQDEIPAFSAQPTPGLPRVVVFGESSVRAGSGLPLEREFPALLQARLRSMGRPAEVLNLGRASLDSQEIRGIVEASLAYQPAVAVLYMGHNDVGNAYMMRLYGGVGSALEARARSLLGRLRLYGLLAAAVAAATPAPARSPNVGSTMGGQPLSPQARALIEASFRQNLDFILRSLQEAGVQPVVATVASNLEDWWTRVPACPDALPRGSWRRDPQGQLWLQAGNLPPGALEAAAAAAPECPEVLYLRGMALLRSDRAAGLALLARSRDLDVVPLRATSGVVQAIRDVAAARGVPLVDVEAAVNGRDPMRMYFTDNLHLSAVGHELVAELLASTAAPLLPAAP